MDISICYSNEKVGYEMITIDNFEKIIAAALANDSSLVVHLLDEAIEDAKKKNHKNTVSRLKNIAKNVTPTKSRYYAQTNSAIAERPRSSNLYDYSIPSTSLDEVVLSVSQKEKVSRLLNEWENFEELEENGLKPNNRLIIYGPPGTGKTKLARAVANQLDMPMIYVRLDELISSYLGNTGKNIREIFSIAKHESVIIFLDEIDTIAKQRDDVQELGELKRVVTVLLQNIDLLSSHSILIAATNHEKLLDSAIWRRFPLKLEMELPDAQERQSLIKLFLGEWGSNIDLALFTELSEGMSGSDIENAMDGARRNALIKKETVSDVSLIKALLSEEVRPKSKKGIRDKVYKLAESLVVDGYSLRDVSKLSGIPYTTLRDNVKAQS